MDTLTTKSCKNKSNDNNNNDRPDDDNNDDTDCSPRQDKQPVLPQDISLTAPTVNANNTSHSLIKSPTDKSTNLTNTDNTNINPTIHPHDCPRWQQEHKQLQAMFPQLVTVHVAVPSPIPIYARPIPTWNGTTPHTDIVYDDDDDYDDRTDYDYAYGDTFNMNDPSVQLQFEKCLQTVQFQNCLQATHRATPKAPSQQHKSKHTTMKQTTMKHTHKDLPPPYTYDSLKLLFLTTHYKSANDYTNQFPLYTVPHYYTEEASRP